MPWLINAAQLDKFRKNQKNLIILDASLYPAPRDAKEEFLEKHIMDAQFFSITDFNDKASLFPNMLTQDEKQINDTLSQLGIRNDYKIILYDNNEHHSACRALWMFKVFGHNPNQLYILDGGFKAWEKYGGKTESGAPSFSAKPYTAKLQLNYLRTLENIKINLQIPKEQIVDLRHAVRFAGGPDPRIGVRKGHIPNSFCLPYNIFFDKENLFLPLDKIRRKIVDTGVDLTIPITTLCGSGISAPILNFILDLMSLPNNALYDGSWSEYGAEQLFAGEQSLEERPIETCIS